MRRQKTATLEDRIEGAMSVLRDMREADIRATAEQYGIKDALHLSRHTLTKKIAEQFGRDH